MRGFKLVAIAIAALIALILGIEAVGFIFHLVAYLAVAALVAGGVYVAFKLGRASNRQVSKKTKDSEVQDSYTARPLPRADVQQYTPPAPPTVTRPVTGPNIDDELAKLKREMGS
ncbi:MAG TPA: hypothetical protein VGG16_06050 [Streptosporangiaceae bacterium]|jgi:hypothetical protein